MYLYGSTITATQYPKFVHDGKEYVLPRPYGNCKPDHVCNNMLGNNEYLSKMIVDIESIVIHFLQYHCKNLKLARETLLDIQASKDLVPESLRMSGTFFTHSTVIGTFNELNAHIPPHFDENDVISVIFHAGKVKEGGETLYYNGSEKKKYWRRSLCCAFLTWPNTDWFLSEYIAFCEEVERHSMHHKP